MWGYDEAKLTALVTEKLFSIQIQLNIISLHPSVHSYIQPFTRFPLFQLISPDTHSFVPLVRNNLNNFAQTVPEQPVKTPVTNHTSVFPLRSSYFVVRIHRNIISAKRPTKISPPLTDGGADRRSSCSFLLLSYVLLASFTIQHFKLTCSHT